MDHINKISFFGVLAVLDTASDRSPSGARGHRVIMASHVAQAALGSLRGMAVNCRSDFAGHDTCKKVGIIEEAVIVDSQIVVTGFLYGRDFPQVVESIAASAEDMGMSWEMANAHIPDMRQEVWEIDRLTFTGAAILFKAKAAYTATSFTLHQR